MSIITMKASEHLHDELKRKDWLINELETKIRTLKAIQEKEVWYWQGDGHDYPESLVCPVVMSADQLRTLISEVEYLREANKTLSAEKETLREDSRMQRYMKSVAREQRDRMTNMVGKLLGAVDAQTREKFKKEMRDEC